MGTALDFEAVSPIDSSVRRHSGFDTTSAVQAGRWVFCTGRRGDQADGDGDLAEGLPSAGRPQAERQAERILQGIDETLSRVGSGLNHVARLDQYYPTWRAVDHYHVARKRAFGDYIPPSTSILQSELLSGGAQIEVEAIGIVPGPDWSVQAGRPSDVAVPRGSGFAPVARVGDYVFVAGQMASDEQGVVPDVQLGPGHRWGATVIKLETDYILKHGLEPALRAAGSRLENIVKAQVYVSDVGEIPAFNAVWAAAFPDGCPPTTIIPAVGFGFEDLTIEINAIATVDGAKESRQEIAAHDMCLGYEHQTRALRVGDLLFMPGLMAVDERGLVESARPGRGDAYWSSAIKAQMADILGKATTICERAGTSLENVVRIQHFHTSLSDFQPACEAWAQRLGGQPLPITAVRVPEPLPVPDATVLADIWVYAPQR